MLEFKRISDNLSGVVREVMREKEKYALHGIVVSLNTPFDENNHIDFRSLEKLIDLHLSEGAVGFLTTAQAAEVFELTLDERIDLIRYVSTLSILTLRFPVRGCNVRKRCHQWTR